MTIKCKHCEQEKPEDQMKVRAGKPSQVCLECAQSRIGLGAGAPRKKTRRKKAEPVEQLRMTCPGGGHGFDASVTDEDCMQITQNNPDADPDNVVLTRDEAHLLKTFIEMFLNRPATS